jgi:predicted enzyme related to lactoylglutathione lyase
MTTQKTTHAPGTFCWPELSSKDQKGAETFYTALFGWQMKQTPMGPDSHYTIFTKGDESVAAAAQMDGDMQGRVPSHWLSYVSVANVDQSLEQAKGLGATVVAGPFDVMEHGRMAVLTDPQGATFALWQAYQHPGITRFDEEDSLVWTELLTNDTQKAADFYQGLFGWGTEKFPGGMDYTVWKRGSESAGGMMGITPEMGAMPPNWTVYFAVKDADAAVKKAKELGGKAMREPWTVEGVGRIAILQDPQGAVFAILKPDPAQK